MQRQDKRVPMRCDVGAAGLDRYREDRWRIERSQGVLGADIVHHPSRHGPLSGLALRTVRRHQRRMTLVGESNWVNGSSWY